MSSFIYLLFTGDFKFNDVVKDNLHNLKLLGICNNLKEARLEAQNHIGVNNFSSFKEVNFDGTLDNNFTLYHNDTNGVTYWAYSVCKNIPLYKNKNSLPYTIFIGEKLYGVFDKI